ncbi:restriction endonuclease subunit S, partial [Mycoplasmopsis verecunda]
TNQLDTDTDVNVLLEQIAKQKQELIDKKEIKASKNNYHIYKQDNKWYEEVSGKITDITDQIPYEIPKCWTWVRLETVANSITDGVHQKPNYIKEGVKFISVKNINDGILDDKFSKYISENEFNSLFTEQKIPKKGDILYGKCGTIGVSTIVHNNEKYGLFVSLALIKLNKELISNKYINLVLSSPFLRLQGKLYTVGVGNKTIPLKSISKLLLPLPPLEEQQRIVDKLNELIPLIEKLK